MRIVDLRSDTLTQPTMAMRRAMADAEVGDDVFGEDPTVMKLEETAAEMMGKEAALLVTSGTMANLVSQMAHCRPGDEMIVGDQAHIFYYEQGGSAAIGGIHPRTVRNRTDGTMAISDIRSAVRPEDIHFPRTRLIALENTHNRCSGSPLAPDYLSRVADLAEAHGIRIHMDGARIFNAAAALGIKARELAASADSISFCLSKGLAAPVGSLVCGSAGFVERARRIRKVLGGGMRQAGVLAAAGLVALSEMVDRLTEDHATAEKLAEGLSRMPGLSVNPAEVKTNIVYFRTTGISPEELSRRLNAQGVKVLVAGPDLLRAVTYYQVTPEAIDAALNAFARALA